MTHLGLSSLASIQSIGEYGPHLNALVWLTITAVLMYVGPATVSMIYLLISDGAAKGAIFVTEEDVHLPELQPIPQSSPQQDRPKAA